MEELPTHDGGGQRDLTLQEQASSTVVELVNHGIINKEEDATINVYQMTQSMDNNYDKGVQGHCPIYGVEYQLNSGSPFLA